MYILLATKRGGGVQDEVLAVSESKSVLEMHRLGGEYYSPRMEEAPLKEDPCKMSTSELSLVEATHAVDAIILGLPSRTECSCVYCEEYKARIGDIRKRPKRYKKGPLWIWAAVDDGETYQYHHFPQPGDTAKSRCGEAYMGKLENYSPDEASHVMPDRDICSGCFASCSEVVFNLCGVVIPDGVIFGK